MQIANNTSAIPWQFTPEEGAQINDLLNAPLLRAYFQSLKASALECNLIDPSESTQSPRINNAYVSGEVYVLDVMLDSGVHVPLITTPKGD